MYDLFMFMSWTHILLLLKVTTSHFVCDGNRVAHRSLLLIIVNNFSSHKLQQQQALFSTIVSSGNPSVVFSEFAARLCIRLCCEVWKKGLSNR